MHDSLIDPLVAAVRRAWSKGWQPRDLVWLVKTNIGRLEGAWVREAILAEAEAYEGSPLDSRWQAQLDELAGDRCGGGRAPSSAAVEDYVGALPPVPVLIPPPGQAAGSISGCSGPLDSRVLGRVRALLAKAESTEFPDEAESLSAKAQELMARHAINAVLVAAGGESGEPEARRVHIDSPYAPPKSLLLCEVADANRCRVVWNRHFQIATVFGFPADLISTEVLFTSLLVQATTALLGSRPEYGEGIKSFRRSFLMAYGSRVGERLAEISRSAVSEVDDGSLLPVLASRAEAVDEVTTTMFPMLGRYRVSHSSPGGMAAGRRAAERADLAQRRVGALRSLPDRT